MSQDTQSIEATLIEIIEFSQYDAILNRLLQMHLQDREFANLMTEKQAILVSILQRLYQMNPETETLSTQEMLGLRAIRQMCDMLGREDPRYERMVGESD